MQNLGQKYLVPAQARQTGLLTHYFRVSSKSRPGLEESTLSCCLMSQDAGEKAERRKNCCLPQHMMPLEGMNEHAIPLNPNQPLKMSKASIIEYTSHKRHLYQSHPHRAYRTHLLNEFCETTGLERKYAQKLLGGKRREDGKGRGKNADRLPKYTPQVGKIIKEIWFASEQPCGKRLKQTIPLYLNSYEKRHGLLSANIRELLVYS